MRKAHPAFRMTSNVEIKKNIHFDEKVPDGTIVYTINGAALKDSWKKIVVALNSSKNDQAISLPAGKWKVFIDANKKLKPLKNINYFSESDSINLKSLVNKINKNNLKFYTTSEYSSDSKIDTCNYILLFKNDQLEKHNFLSTIYLSEQLTIKDTIREGFSSRFKELSSINIEEFFKYDNFYAFSYDKEIRKGISGGDLFSNTGTSRSYCNSYNGTYFITLQNKSKLKLKLMNDQICENKNID